MSLQVHRELGSRPVIASDRIYLEGRELRDRAEYEQRVKTVASPLLVAQLAHAVQLGWWIREAIT